MNNRLAFLGVHVVLLLLASTDYSVVTGLADGRYHWDYFEYSSHSGWGVPYAFPCRLPVVLAYLAAYSTGLAAYELIRRSGAKFIGWTGLVLCGLGFASFALELTHWVLAHNRSWIVSAPIALLVLAVVSIVAEYRSRLSVREQASIPPESR